MNIYSYWEGDMPAFISMCREILWNRHSSMFKLAVPSSYFDLPINLKVDYMKAKTVYDNGGFWIDADMIVMKDLTPIFDMLNDNEYVGIPGFFGARKGAPILGRWINAMDSLIARGNLTFSDLIQPLLHDPEFKEFEPLTRAMICPIYHTESNKFFDVAHEDYGDPYIVTLYNSGFPDWFKKMTRNDIMSKNWVISDFFRKALA